MVQTATKTRQVSFDFAYDRLLRNAAHMSMSARIVFFFYAHFT